MFINKSANESRSFLLSVLKFMFVEKPPVWRRSFRFPQSWPQTMMIPSTCNTSLDVNIEVILFLDISEQTCRDLSEKWQDKILKIFRFCLLSYIQRMLHIFLQRWMNLQDVVNEKCKRSSFAATFRIQLLSCFFLAQLKAFYAITSQVTVFSLQRNSVIVIRFVKLI